jgi:hypothetical protein
MVRKSLQFLQLDKPLIPPISNPGLLPVSDILSRVDSTAQDDHTDQHARCLLHWHGRNSAPEIKPSKLEHFIAAYPWTTANLVLYSSITKTIPMISLCFEHKHHFTYLCFQTDKGKQRFFTSSSAWGPAPWDVPVLQINFLFLHPILPLLLYVQLQNSHGPHCHKFEK